MPFTTKSFEVFEKKTIIKARAHFITNMLYINPPHVLKILFFFNFELVVNIFLSSLSYYVH